MLYLNIILYSCLGRRNYSKLKEQNTATMYQVRRLRLNLFVPQISSMTFRTNPKYQSELYSVQCTVYSVQCTVYSVQCTLSAAKLNYLLIWTKEINDEYREREIHEIISVFKYHLEMKWKRFSPYLLRSG